MRTPGSGKRGNRGRPLQLRHLVWWAEPARRTYLRTEPGADGTASLGKKLPPACPEPRGCPRDTNSKLFTAYPGVFFSDDGKILRALQEATHNGGLVMTPAENGLAIDVLVVQTLARGETDPRFHGRPGRRCRRREATRHVE